MNPEFCIVITTCSGRNQAEQLATTILNKRLAACIQLLDIHSFYRWNDAVQSEPEILLLIKTTTDSYETIEATLRKQHPYEVPEVVRVAIDGGLTDYLSWLRESTAPTSS